MYDATVQGAREGDSYVRWSRVNKILRQHSGNIGLNDLMELSCDHVGYPNSICNHPSTIASIIMELHDLALWLAEGNPCENRYKRLEL
jgi:isopenicillin-N N-acyltransferase-like protein